MRYFNERLEFFNPSGSLNDGYAFRHRVSAIRGIVLASVASLVLWVAICGLVKIVGLFT